LDEHDLILSSGRLDDFNCQYVCAIKLSMDTEVIGQCG